MTEVRSALRAGPLPTTGGFEDFVHASGHDMHRTALLLCGDDRLAAALTRTTYAQAFARWRRVRRTRDPVAHTRAIMTRLYLSQLRPGGTGEAPAGSAAAEDAAEPPGLTLLEALARLSVRDRAVLVLRYWVGRSVAATASDLAISEAACRSRASRALDRLGTHVPDLEG